MAIGVYRAPLEFLQVATSRKHPKALADGAQQCTKSIVDMGCAPLAMKRTAELRRWVQRAKELKESCPTSCEPMPEHCKQVLRFKNMELFHEMFSAFRYGDKNPCA